MEVLDKSLNLDVEGLEYDRETLQAGLHQLLVSIFRRRPRLNYFQVCAYFPHCLYLSNLRSQGYHDIVTVFFLTLPQELQFACVEKFSLHRVRDSMSIGLEPVLGLLRYSISVILAFENDICILESPRTCFTSLIQTMPAFFNCAFPLF